MPVKKPNIVHFNDTSGLIVGTSTDDSTKKEWTALVAVEGTFKDAKQRPHEFNVERLETIASYTNKALERGVTIPVCTDHEKTFDNAVGVLGNNAQAYTKTITEEDLPNPEKGKSLIGKVGLFVSDVAITSRPALEKVNEGTVRSVSMGLNLDPMDHRIVEVSLVPIPAIPNMGLFNFNTENAFTWEDLETSESTIEDIKEDFDTLTEKLWKILNNVYTNEAIDITDVDVLRQYIYEALNGFSVRVVDILGLNADPAAASGMDQAGTMTADQAQVQGQMPMQDQMANQQPAMYSRSYKNVAKFSQYTRSPKYRRA